MPEASNADSRTPTDATTTDSQADHSDITILSTRTNQPRSYVWKFFKKTDKYNQCRFIMANGSECGKKLALDKKSSTTSMKNHLETKHQIRDDKLPNQGNILASFKKVKTGHVKKLDLTSLKTNLAYFIADNDLPFSIVDKPSFQRVLTLCNPLVSGMLVKRNAIAKHMRKVYYHYEEYIKKLYFGPCKFIAITQDAWTSPNNVPFMGLTGHFINKHWELMDIALGMAEIKGAHDAKNFASIIITYLEKYDLTNKLIAMTADNISTNAAIGREIGLSDNVVFDYTTQVHGCVAHVINLAAKDGLKVFGEVLDDADEDTEQTSSIHDLVDPPDVNQVNLKKIYNRCHGLVTCTRASPQRAQTFAHIVTMRRKLEEITSTKDHPSHTNPNSNDTNNPINDEAARAGAAEIQAQDEATNYLMEDRTIDHFRKARQDTATKLVVDVATRWNSSYHMFQRLLLLQDSCDEFCKGRDFQKFALTSLEWGYVKQMCDFLEPLSEATEILCKSKFPTMHQVVPIYVVVLKGLKSVIQQYNHNQLAPASKKMINKLEDYFKKVLVKPAPVCATILDPRHKLYYFQERAMTFSEYGLYVSDIRLMFEQEASRYETNEPVVNQSSVSKQTTATSTSQYFEEAIFGTRDAPQPHSIAIEIAQYLGDKPEARDQDVLDFWKQRVKVYPGLSNMARAFLAIPATSCPSEGQFNKTKRILSPQHTSLSSLHVEILLCLKDWHRVFGPLKLIGLVESMSDGEESE